MDLQKALIHVIWPLTCIVGVDLTVWHAAVIEPGPGTNLTQRHNRMFYTQRR
jgi:hypothetical protein